MLYRKYESQKYGAKRRGIGFHLTYNDWLKIWIDSGKLDKRGRNKGNYVMCRVNDSGDYAVGNVYIATCTKNIKDGAVNRRKKINEKDNAIQELRKKLMVQQCYLNGWRESEEKRQQDLKIREYYKDRYNYVLYGIEKK